MKVLLVNPPRFNGIPVIREERCEIVERNSILPPYSLLQIGKILMELKHDVTLIDANGENLRFKELKLAGYDALIFRFTPTTFDYDMGVCKLFKKVNKNGKCIGICFTLRNVWKKVMIQAPDMDFFITGDFEVVLRNLFKDINKFKDIQGLAYRFKGKLYNKSYIRNGFDYDSLSIPAYTLLKSFDYYSINTNIGERFSIIYSSKGCPYNCNYCNVASTPLKMKSVSLVVEEVKLLKNYGVRLVSFFDETFTVNRERVLNICAGLRGVGIRWYCNTRVNLVDLELLKIMKKSGCSGISFGVESGSQKILDLSNKNVKIEEIIKAVKLCRIVGIKTYCAFMFGLPGEDWNTVKETFKFIRKLRPNGAQFNIAVPYPGTSLYEKFGNGLSWRDLFQDKALVSMCDLSIEELNKIRKKAYTNLYFNPFWLIGNFLFVLRNPYDFKLGIRYFFKIMKNYFFYGMEKAH
ncbi:MAG TPA: radical SAM protein [Candidatus Nanoarchaeia archaeon]|nr:radical SAM protein [Candidatus Nanoarchaeia archaeon]